MVVEVFRCLKQPMKVTFCTSTFQLLQGKQAPDAVAFSRSLRLLGKVKVVPIFPDLWENREQQSETRKATPKRQGSPGDPLPNSVFTGAVNFEATPPEAINISTEMCSLGKKWPRPSSLSFYPVSRVHHSSVARTNIKFTYKYLLNNTVLLCLVLFFFKELIYLIHINI